MDYHRGVRTLVSIHDDRAVSVVWIWRGFAGLVCRSSEEGEAVDDDCGMVVFHLVVVSPRPKGNVTDHVEGQVGFMTDTRKTRDEQHTTLLVGFDCAWTASNSGGLVGVLQSDDGTFHELGEPQIVSYTQAEDVILNWQAKLAPTATSILLDQPTIVTNYEGQRPVENIVGSAVSLRRGGMQPANTSKREMFGTEAPIWPFLTRFGGPRNPLERVIGTQVFETYPVLAMIALDWTLPDSRPAGCLPRYNPENLKFLISDWKHVCELASGAFSERGLMGIVRWIDGVCQMPRPRKCHQDGLDACICLLVALYLAERKDCLMVGDLRTGYIVVPHSAGLHAEFIARCNKTGRAPSEWVRVFRQTSALGNSQLS
jgi:predicted RNase H-like nuclease